MRNKIFGKAKELVESNWGVTAIPQEWWVQRVVNDKAVMVNVYLECKDCEFNVPLIVNIETGEVEEGA